MKKNITIISLNPSYSEATQIRSEYLKITNTDDTWEFNDLWRDLYKVACTESTHEGITLDEAQALAEPIRIAHPDQNVNIYNSKGDFIGNTTWNDQMKMFWEYPTYTEEGKRLREERMAEAAVKGLIASWE